MWTPTLAEAVIGHLLLGIPYSPPSTYYLSLHDGDPGDTGAGELSGSGYSRQAVAFVAGPEPGTAVNASVIDIQIPAATVSHVGLWDAQSGGDFLWPGQAVDVRTLPAGDYVRFEPGALVVTLQPEQS